MRVGLMMMMIVLLGVGPWAAAGVDLTFFAWSDQHVRADGDASHLLPALDVMHRMEGVEYPPEVGRRVKPAAFLLGCGDCTDWPSRAAVSSFDRIISEESKRLPCYNIMGNHDEGDVGGAGRIMDTWAVMVAVICGMAVAQLGYLLAKRVRGLRRPVVRAGCAAVAGLAAGMIAFYFCASDDRAMAKWIISKHGGTSYSFNQGGVHFVMVFSAYDPHQRMTREALDFVRADLARVPKRQPVIVASHYCFESIGNKDEWVDAMAGANVVLVLGGHYHQSTYREYRGLRFAQVSSPRTGSGFSVIRVSDDGVVVCPYDFKKREWARLR